MLLLYTEEQLEQAYEIYRVHQIKQDLSFMVLENFRKLYEELAEGIFEEDGLSIRNNYYARLDLAK